MVTLSALAKLLACVVCRFVRMSSSGRLAWTSPSGTTVVGRAGAGVGAGAGSLSRGGLGLAGTLASGGDSGEAQFKEASALAAAGTHKLCRVCSSATAASLAKGVQCRQCGADWPHPPGEPGSAPGGFVPPSRTVREPVVPPCATCTSSLPYCCVTHAAAGAPECNWCNATGTGWTGGW